MLQFQRFGGRGEHNFYISSFLLQLIVSVSPFLCVNWIQVFFLVSYQFVISGIIMKYMHFKYNLWMYKSALYLINPIRFVGQLEKNHLEILCEIGASSILESSSTVLLVKIKFLLKRRIYRRTFSTAPCWTRNPKEIDSLYMPQQVASSRFLELITLRLLLTL